MKSMSKTINENIISLQFVWSTNIKRVTLQVYALKTSACMGELYLTRLALSTFSPVQSIIVINSRFSYFQYFK